ncbi:MAG: hypothetical protein V1779_15540 [bacterium]
MKYATISLLAFLIITNANAEDKKSMIGPYISVKATTSNINLMSEKSGIAFDCGAMYFIRFENLDDFGVIFNGAYSRYSYQRKMGFYLYENATVDYGYQYLKFGVAFDFFNIFAGADVCTPLSSSVDFNGFPASVEPQVRKDIKKPETSLTIEPKIGYILPVYKSEKGTFYIFGFASYILEKEQMLSINFGISYLFGM